MKIVVHMQVSIFHSIALYTTM